MLKIVTPNCWDSSLWDSETPRAALIKRSSRGVIDKGSFIKRACSSSDELLSKIASLDVKPGEELIHLIALGTTETYGPNRNGDGFSRAACEKYHPTFTKHARFYRDHKNTDPKKSYGVVKASALNKEMDRVELIVALNGTKQAADANGGLVADKELEKLASHKDIPVSMACSVPYDICSYCGNKAETQDAYCMGTDEGGRCKAGGLKHNMGKLASVDGKLVQLYADNTKPDFFDISHVFIPADRIAYSSGVLTKTASANGISLGGAELARRMCLTAPSPDIPGFTKTSRALQYFKEAVADFHSQRMWQKRASFLGVMSFKPLEDMAAARRYKFAELHRALVDEGVCLTPSQFVQLAGDYNIKDAAFLGEILAPLSNDWLEKTADFHDPYMPADYASEGARNWVRSQHLPSMYPDKFLKQAAMASMEVAPDFTLTKNAVYEYGREPDIAKAVAQYAMYKLAFVASLPDRLQETAANLITGRDYISF